VNSPTHPDRQPRFQDHDVLAGQDRDVGRVGPRARRALSCTSRASARTARAGPSFR
jgi:hypothetical protein